MEYKKATDILISLIDKRPLDEEEKEAVKMAIGVLGWASLSQSRIKNLKAKKDKKTER